MIKIHREVYGQGQPLVMIHGWSMHSGIWRGFAQGLAEHFQVICLDLPGHGRSEGVTPYTLERISAAMLTAIPRDRFHLLGWSLGGTVAIDLANRFPEKVASLTLLAANPRFVQGEQWPGVKAEVLKTFADNLAVSCQATLMRFLALQVNGLANGKELLKQLKQAVRECEAPAVSTLRGGLDILAHSDLTLSFQRLGCPVQAILGGRDSLIPVQCGERLQHLRPDANIRLLRDAGHVPFLSHQREIVELLAGAL